MIHLVSSESEISLRFMIFHFICNYLPYCDSTFLVTLGDSSLNQCENANLEPPSKEPVATASTSNNINYTDYHVKKRKLRSQVDDIDPTASTSTSNINEVKNGQNKAAAATNRPQNDIEKYLGIRKQVEQRRKNLFPVFLSKLPEGFKDYLMNRKTYLLQGNAKERLRYMITFKIIYSKCFINILNTFYNGFIL